MRWAVIRKLVKYLLRQAIIKCVNLYVHLCRDSLASQLEASLTKADSEQLARSIAEEQYSDLEKEKIMKELEIKDMMARHLQELSDKDNTISSVRQRERYTLSQMTKFGSPHYICLNR